MSLARAISRRTLSIFRVSLYANSLFLVFALGINALMGSAFWVIAARIYSVEQVGIAASLVAAVSLLALAAGLGLDTGLVRFLPSANEDRTTLINASYGFTILSSTLASLIFLAGAGLWWPGGDVVLSNELIIVAFVGSVVSFNLLFTTYGVFIGLRRSHFVVIMNVVAYALRILFAVVAGMSIGGSALFPAFGLGAGLAVTAALLFLIPRVIPTYRPSVHVRLGQVWNMLRYSFANFSSVLLWQAPVLMIPLLVVGLLGAREAGFYAASYTLASLLEGVANVIASSLVAEGAHDTTLLELQYRRAMKALIFLLLPAVLVVLVGSDSLLRLFGHNYAEGGALLLQLFALASLPYGFTVLYLSVRRIQKRHFDVLFITVVRALMIVALVFLLIQPMGIKSVGIVWLAAHAVTCVLAVMGTLLLAREWRKSRKEAGLELRMGQKP